MGSFRNKRFLLLLFLSIKHVASVSLSEFQRIAGFSDSCMTVWTETIPGCTRRDFSKDRMCSAICVAGLDIISEEVKRACGDARVNSDTLLGQFLQGSSVSILCPNVNEDSTTTSTKLTESSSSQTQPSAEPASTTSQPEIQTAETTIITSTTQTTSQERTSTASPQPTAAATSIAATSTSSSSSVTSTTPSPSTLEISIGATTGTGTVTTTTNTERNRASSRTTSSAASSTTNIEAKGFGGVGDAFNILGNDASRSKQPSQQIIAGLGAGAVLMAGAMW